MMPVANNTQIPLPTQVTLTNAPLPGTAALRSVPDTVAATPPEMSIGPDYKGSGGYASQAPSQTATTSSASSLLATPIPASLSNSIATLAPGTMFAAQLYSQDEVGGTHYLSVYENFISNSEVKYKPSNATLPEPAPQSLFAKLLTDTQNQNVRQTIELQQAPRSVVAQAQVSAQAAPITKPVVQSARPKAEIQAAALRSATQAYHATVSRNDVILEAAKVEPVDHLDDVSR